jgi:hypothetical protein
LIDGGRRWCPKTALGIGSPNCQIVADNRTYTGIPIPRTKMPESWSIVSSKLFPQVLLVAVHRKAKMCDRNSTLLVERQETLTNCERRTKLREDTLLQDRCIQTFSFCVYSMTYNFFWWPLGRSIKRVSAKVPSQRNAWNGSTLGWAYKLPRGTVSQNQQTQMIDFGVLERCSKL